MGGFSHTGSGWLQWGPPLICRQEAGMETYLKLMQVSTLQ